MSDFVPSRFVPGFETLRDLSDDEAERLLASVEALPVFSPLPAISGAVREVLPAAQQGRASAVVDSLLSLRGQLRAGDWTLEELARRAAESGSITPEGEAALEELAGRIERLLRATAIATTTGAADLLIQHERPFRSVRVFTDVRPVFGDDVSAPPQGAVILENLQIEFWTKEGGRNVATFGLDEGDLRSLKDVVDRAIDKTATLRQFLESVGVSAFDVEGSMKAAVKQHEEDEDSE